MEANIKMPSNENVKTPLVEHFKMVSNENIKMVSSDEHLAWDERLDPDKEAKELIYCMSTSDDRLLVEGLSGVQRVFSLLKPGDVRIPNVLRCLYQHFVGWDELNARIFLYGDCALTYAASVARHLVIPFLQLEPPVGYEAPNPNALGELELPAIMWAVQCYNDVFDINTSVVNELLRRTSDSTLRLCFTTNVALRSGTRVVLPLHALVSEWVHTLSHCFSQKQQQQCRNIAGTIQLFLLRSDDDGGGGVDLRVKHDGHTASEFMKLKLTHDLDLLWRQTKDLLDAATKRTTDYADKLLLTLSAALGNSLAGIQPLHALVASYSPALYPPVAPAPAAPDA